MRTCPWPDCAVPIADRFYLCRPHWRGLARGLQAEVSAASLRLQRAQATDDVGRIQEAGTQLRAVQARVLRVATAEALP